jgi:hypothetical protein
LFEIFQAVLQRGESLQGAQAEVAKVKAESLAAWDGKKSLVSTAETYGDADLNAEVEARLRSDVYDIAMIPADEERIAKLVANKEELEVLLATGVEYDKDHPYEPGKSSQSTKSAEEISAAYMEAEKALNELRHSNS